MRRLISMALVPAALCMSLSGCALIAGPTHHPDSLEWIEIQEPHVYLKANDPKATYELKGEVKADGSCMTIVADSVPFVPVFNQGDRRPYALKDGDEVSLKGEQGATVATAPGMEGYVVPESCLGVDHGMLYYAVPER